MLASYNDFRSISSSVIFWNHLRRIVVNIFINVWSNSFVKPSGHELFFLALNNTFSFMNNYCESERHGLCPTLCDPGFSNTWTVSFQMFKLVLEKAEEPEIKLPTSAWSWKKQESSRKASISALLTMPKPLTVWITKNCGKFWKRWEYQTTWSASWEICMQVRKQQLELDMEQQTGSK